MNITILMGRLTRDPELRSASTTGDAICTFNIAVRKRYARPDDKDGADFFKVVAWRQNATFLCDHFHKGDMVAVRGYLTNNNYTDSNGGKHYEAVVQAEELSYC